VYETYITIVGNVVDDIRLRTTATGVNWVSFRVASTARRKDGETGEWIDGNKLFLTCKAWRGTAENIVASLRKGDPVIALGRQCSREYVTNESAKIAYEVELDAIGHDQTRGTSQFTKATRSYAFTAVEVDEAGLPVDPNELDSRVIELTADLASVG
jgi:single-strand DNA-binding protein